MKSRKYLIHAVLVAAIALSGIQNARAMDTAEVRKKFCETYADLGTMIYSVRETMIAGIYELATKVGEVIYYAPATNHLLVGKIYDKDGKNIADETRNRLTLERLQVFIAARDQAISIGSGPVEVIEITNPDCSFCRKLSRHLDRNPDVTRRLFLVGGTEALQKEKYLAASPDKEKALREVMSGLYDNDEAFEKGSYDDKGLVASHQKLAEQADLASTPMVIINGILVEGAELDTIDALISQAKNNKKGTS